MRRILSTLLLGCLLLGVGVSAATGQYVVVEVEAFESWGILHWGTWEPLDETLLSTRMHQPTEEDENAIADVLATCESTSDLGIGVRGACTALDRLRHVRDSAYDIDALLGRP